jgi:hypothetical protein
VALTLFSSWQLVLAGVCVVEHVTEPRLFGSQVVVDVASDR